MKENDAICAIAMDEYLLKHGSRGFTTEQMKRSLGEKYSAAIWKGAILRNGKRTSDAMSFDKKTKTWFWL